MSSECGLDHNACTCTQGSLSHCHLLSFAYLAIAVPKERKMLLRRRTVELPRLREGKNHEYQDSRHRAFRLWEKMLSSAELRYWYKIRECHTFNPGCHQSFPEDPCWPFLSFQPFLQPHTQPFPDSKSSRTYKAVLSSTVPSAWDALLY